MEYTVGVKQSAHTSQSRPRRRRPTVRGSFGPAFAIKLVDVVTFTERLQSLRSQATLTLAALVGATALAAQICCDSALTRQTLSGVRSELLCRRGSSG